MGRCRYVRVAAIFYFYFFVFVELLPVQCWMVSVLIVCLLSISSNRFHVSCFTILPLFGENEDIDMKNK